MGLQSIVATLEQSGGKIFGAGGAGELFAMKPTTLASRIKNLGIDKSVIWGEGERGERHCFCVNRP